MQKITPSNTFNKIIFQKAVGFHEQGQLKHAESLYKSILKTEPQQADTLHLLGVIAYQRGQAQIAVDLINQSLDINPRNIEAYSNIGNAFQDLNRYDDALASYNHALNIKPDFIAALLNRSALLHELLRYDEALAGYDLLLHINPNYVDALSNRGNVLYDIERYEEALASYNSALAIKPDFAGALNNRGNTLKKLKRYDEALASYDHALTINADFIPALLGRANLLMELRRYDEALASYDDLISVQANHAEAFCNRGLALKELHRYDDAFTSYQRALSINPEYVEAFLYRSNALNECKRHEEALADLSRVLTIKPDFAFLLGDWLHTKMKICDWHDFNQNIDRLEQGIKSGKKLATPFPVLALSSSLALQQITARCYAQVNHPNNLLLPALDKHTHKKIKIGYFSADFRHHPVSYLMSELFACHDRSRFEIIVFSFHAANPKDEIRLKSETVFDQFIDVSAQSDEQIVRLARQLEIDIAVDLYGVTSGYRASIFAMRAAPIQVNYLGYPGTMGGVDYIDYLIADPVLIPMESQSYYDEKIVYLPHCYMVSDSKRLIAEQSFTRAELGLPEQGFIFCCFNNNYKITPPVFDSWMRILQAVEGSVLWLFEDNVSAARNLRREAAAHKINPERLIFAQRMSLAEHLARYRIADLFLDTVPCNAGKTASDALWAGLPVLTCMDETFASRMGASLLNAIDLPELITTSPEDYEAKAIQLATQSEQLAVIKQKLADNRHTQPLFNTRLFTQHIEATYQAMYTRYQADLAPATIHL